MAIRKATKQIAKTPGGVVLQCTGSINTDELIRIVDDRAVRSVVSTGFGFNVIALEKTVLSYSHEGIKNEPPPLQ